MKAEVIRAPEEPKVFKPVTIQVTFDTADELFNFWHRMNVSWNTFNKPSSVRNPGDVNVVPVWKVVDNVLRDRGLRG